MSRKHPRNIERLESYLVNLIQQEGADQGHTGWIKLFLDFLNAISKLFGLVVAVRHFAYRSGILREHALGAQVISIGNVTAGGTGKTPVVEIFARELLRRNRKVAILSRGHRKKELPFWQRVFCDRITPPRIVSDGKRILLDSEMGGDEPYMLANNLPGVVVLVDRDRVKSAQYAIRRFGCDTLILDDGFQYRRLRHSHEIVLVDSTNPFGNGHLLPRGILREKVSAIARADFIFITKSKGKSALLRQRLKELNPRAEIIECCHAPRFLSRLYTHEQEPLEWLRGKKLAALSGIAVPQGFENFLRQLGGTILRTERFADHHRYTSSEVLGAINQAADLGADALITTEQDAVRFPRLETTPVKCLYLRIAIEILAGGENFSEIINRICFRKGGKSET